MKACDKGIPFMETRQQPGLEIVRTGCPPCGRCQKPGDLNQVIDDALLRKVGISPETAKQGRIARRTDIIKTLANK